MKSRRHDKKLCEEWRKAAEPLRTTVGAQLRIRREELGLSQTALAAQTGMRQPRIAHVETGQPASLKILVALADALGMEFRLVDKGAP